MRPIATVFAISLAALSFAAPPAFADGNPQPDGRRKADYAVQKQELLRVREKIQSLQQQIERGETEMARANHDAQQDESAQHSERMHQLECKIVDAEAQLVELREGRRYTEHHPDVKSAAGVLAGLRRLHQAEMHNAHRAAAEHRARMQNQHAGGPQQLHGLRAQLDRLTVLERNLVASIDYPKPQKVKKAAKLPKRPKPPKPPMARDGGERGARTQPGVEDRLARLEKTVKELVHMIKEREKVARDRVALEKAMVEREAREGRRRGAPARGPRDGRPVRDGERGRDGEGARGGRGGEGGGRNVEQREHLMKLRTALEGERQESEELRKIIKELEQRVRGEQEESEELRKMLRRMKAERGERGERQENEELRKIINELEQRVRAEQEESEELRKMLRRMKAERGERGERQGSEELRKIINELEQRVRSEQEESNELREILRRMKAERGERGKRGDQQQVVDELERALKGARMEAADLRKSAVHLREKLAAAERGGGHVRGLERRLEVERHENAELRELIEELEAEMKAFRKKLERR